MATQPSNDTRKLSRSSSSNQTRCITTDRSTLSNVDGDRLDDIVTRLQPSPIKFQEENSISTAAQDSTAYGTEAIEGTSSPSEQVICVPQSSNTHVSSVILHGTHRNRRAALLAAKAGDDKPPQVPEPPAPFPHTDLSQTAQSKIFFDARVAVPYVHEPQNGRQLICPNCSTTLTRRYCNGSTTHASTLCPKHVHLDSLSHPASERQHPTGKYWYDRRELSNIRALLLNGDLRAPSEQIIRVADGVAQNVDASTFSRGELRRMAEQQALERFLPGCAPNKQDWGSRWGTPIGFARVEGEAYAFRRVWPVQPEVEYLHALGCAGSGRPEHLLATRDEVSLFRRYAGIMYRNEFEREYQWCADCSRGGIARGKKCRECGRLVRRWFEMARAPGWAIGVFLKRCNGMYINALGYIKDRKATPYGRSGNQEAEGSEEIGREKKEDDFVRGLEFSARTLLAKEEKVCAARMTEKCWIEDSWRRWDVIRKEKARRQEEGDWKGMESTEGTLS